MRTFEEIKASVDHAMEIRDANALLQFATELDSISTPEAKALAGRSRGWAFHVRGDYPAALECFQLARAIYTELGDHRSAARSNTNIGVVYRSTGDFSAALEHYQRALALLETLGDHDGVARATGNIGIVHLDTGNYPAALEHFHRALALHEALGDHYGVARITGNIGSVHRNAGNYVAALEYDHRALAIHEELGDRSNVALITGNIGSTYSETGNYPAAMEYQHRALALSEELGERSSVANVISNIGNLHNKTGNYPAALDHHHRALAMYEELGNRNGVARVTSNIGNVHVNTNNYAAALDHYHRALILHEELGVRSGVALVTVNILSALISFDSYADADSLLQKLDAMQIASPSVVVKREQCRAVLQEKNGSTDEAVATLVAALQIAREHSVLAFQAEVHKDLRDLAQKRNDFATYIEHNNEFTRITEEINGKDTATKLAMQEAEKKMAKERNEHEKHLAILHSTLPKHIADRVARGEVVNDHHDNAAVIFLDIVGFTTISEQLSSAEVVQLLESVFTALDDVCKNHDVVKIKTIGDSYMAVAFPHSVPRFARNDSDPVPHSVRNDSALTSFVIEARDVALRAANAALDMLEAVSHIVSLDGSPVEVRLGVHCGAVTAGVIGTARMQYDVWGDTVNVASRMESTSLPGRIHVSEAFATAIEGEIAKERNSETDVIPSVSEEGEMVKERKSETGVIPSVSEEPFPIPYSLFPRGELEIKGKGLMTTYWLEGITT